MTKQYFIHEHCKQRIPASLWLTNPLLTQLIPRICVGPALCMPNPGARCTPVGKLPFLYLGCAYKHVVYTSKYLGGVTYSARYELTAVQIVPT